MPSVGSTPTLTSPQQQQQQLTMQQHAKLQQQHLLPLQLQLQLHKHQQQQQQQQQQHHHQVTTTQPSPAGTCVAALGDAVDDVAADADDEPSPLSSSNSFSSIDTNQTLLNSIATQTQQQLQRLSVVSGNRATATTNRSYRSKYSQFMIITPAVSIDRNFDNATGSVDSVIADDNDSYFNNGNIFRMTLLQSSIDSGNSSDSSFRSNYNPYIHSSRHHLLPKSQPTFYTFSSWRWCTLICAAMRCFGAGGRAGSAGHHNHHGGSAAKAPYSTSFSRPPYKRSRSSGVPSSATPHRRLRSSSTSAEPFAAASGAAAFTPRKTRDHMNNITYEL